MPSEDKHDSEATSDDATDVQEGRPEPRFAKGAEFSDRAQTLRKVHVPRRVVGAEGHSHGPRRSETFSRPLDLRRVATARYRRSGSSLLIAGGLTTLSLTVTALNIFGSSGTSPIDLDTVAIQSGCVIYPSNLVTDVGKAKTVEVTIGGGACRPGVTPSGPAQSLVSVGEQVQAQVLAPSLPGAVTPLQSPVQRVVCGGCVANWSWDILPSQPGVFSASLIVTVQSVEGPPLAENKRIPIEIRVEATAAYRINMVLTGIKEFFTSIEGIVVSIAAIVVAAGGIGAAVFKRRKKGGTADEDGDRSRRDGYM